MINVFDLIFFCNLYVYCACQLCERPCNYSRLVLIPRLATFVCAGWHGLGLWIFKLSHTHNSNEFEFVCNLTHLINTGEGHLAHPAWLHAGCLAINTYSGTEFHTQVNVSGPCLHR